MVPQMEGDLHGAIGRLVGAAALFLIGVLLECAPAAAQTFTDPKFAAETVATLAPYAPVGIAWAPDSRMFIWTKQGVVRIVKNGQLLPTPFLNISNRVNSAGDRGLLGLALHPNFAQNGWVYLLYTYEHAGNPNSTAARTSRLTRVTADPNNPDVALPDSEVVLLGTLGIPPCSNYAAGADCIPADWDSHVIGTLRFAPDGTLFISNGDAASYNYADSLALRAQDLNSYAGKILRVKDDGTAPRGNPFDDGTNSIRSKIWSYGLRNPYRFTLHPGTGEPYIADVGWNGFEEFNTGRGANFGWPCYEGVGPQPDYQSAFVQCRNLPSSAVTPPLYSYGRSEGATAISGPFYTGNRYPTVYQDNWFVADYSAGWIRRIAFDSHGHFLGIFSFATEVAGVVSLEQGPDGLLYYVDFVTGRIRRLVHSSPVARISATPTAGYSPLTVEFSSEQSINPGSAPLQYFWEFGDGATSTEPNPVHIYVSPTVASFIARLTVTAQSGESSTDTVRIVVGSLPPLATILEPADGTPAVPGDFIIYRGMATDPDEGTLPDSALTWVVLLHHNDHVHSRQITTGANGAFLVENHTHGTFAYQIILTAVDSSGLIHRVSVFLPVEGQAGAPDPHLLAAYGLDDGAGTLASDSSGNGYDAQVFNGTWLAQGRYGGALQFNGSSSRVTGPDAALGDRFTLMAWVYKSSHPNTWEQIAGVRGDRDMFVYNGQLAFWDGFDTLTFGSALPLNTWMHLAITYDGSTLRGWLNGQPRGNPINRSYGPVFGRIQMGSWWSGSSNVDFFAGRLDEVRIFDRTLSQSEIQAMMDTPIGAPDTTPPVVVIFSPANSALLAGTVRLEALAADNVAVAGVRFQLNGQNLGPEITTTPYFYFWDTTTVENGEYVLTAIARDSAGLTRTSDPLSLFVANGEVNRPPTISASGPGIVTTAGQAALHATATDDGLPDPPGTLTTLWSKFSGPGTVSIADPSALSTTATFDTPGNYTLRFTASDGELSRSADVGILVTAPPLPTVTAPNGGELAFTGLPLEIRWSVTAAAAVTGFDVLATTGNGYFHVPGCSGLPAGARSCTWTAPGPATEAARVLVRVQDVDGNFAEDVSDGDFAIVAGTPTVTVVEPNTAVEWVIGSTRSIVWTHTLGEGQSVRIELSRNGGASWETLATSVPAGAFGASFSWVVSGTATTNALVRVSWTAAPSVGDQSDAAFAIVNPFITVNGPTTNEDWGYATMRRVTWNTNLAPGQVIALRLSTNGGASFPILLGTFPAENREATFRTPTMVSATSQARVRAEWAADPSIGSNSTVNFRIRAPFLTVTRPNSRSHSWTVGVATEITWNHNLGALESVTILLSRDNGSTFPILLFASTPSDDSETVLPLPAWRTSGNSCRVRIIWLYNTAIQDDSNQSFRIR